MSVKYIGILPSSQVPKGAKRVPHHTEKHAGRTVQYYECWEIEKEERVFSPDKLDRVTIKGLTSLLKFWKNE